ncbi:MAG TPA: S1C family serine protease [Magnetospirillum sp.]|nr:S1C family serine protease [Magnetospirillum sp.]
MAGAVLGARAAEPDLRALVDAAKSAEDGAPDMARLSLVNATSNFLLRIDGDIDFPFQVAIDMPIDAQPQSLGVALKAPVEATGRYVVIFDVALAKVTRRVRDMKEQPSRRVVAVNKIENPAFVRAVRQLDKASAKAEKHPGNDKVIKLLDESQLKVGTTPQYLEQPVYGPYNYRLADVEGTKALTVNYYLVDRLSGRYMKSIFDVVERERFTIAYDLDPSDPGQSQLGSDVAREDDVRDWERAPVMVSLSQLLDHALAQGGPTLAAGDLGALLDGVARDRSRAVARAEAERYDQRPLNDPRFDSVVAIYTPDGMGSGFYVRSNIVMTNWHVVEKRPIVELRLYDKRETFGQVIAKDVLLDLALVKVQDRGRPVEFFLGHELLPGERVDAIGHPKRQLFTITRGVVSAIRKQAARTNAAQSSRQVFYVQTDAEINPGNSGGPLFKGDKVVGVNTFNSQQRGDPGGSVMVPNPGMGFAVHYSEAKRFLDEAMRGE